MLVNRGPVTLIACFVVNQDSRDGLFGLSLASSASASASLSLSFVPFVFVPAVVPEEVTLFNDPLFLVCLLVGYLASTSRSGSSFISTSTSGVHP
jgi:hypothetical protein